jgi:predicted TIM-barrel fold metal-dependent hydrolase
MAGDRLISANSHVIEPPNTYLRGFDPHLRGRAPRIERRRTPIGQEFDAWVIDGVQMGSLGAAMRNQPLGDPMTVEALGVWEDVRPGAYDARSMLSENARDGVWGSVLQPSQGLNWYGLRDSELLSEICHVYNDWIADFCKIDPRRLKGVAMLNVDDIDEACREFERCAKLGLSGAFIPEAPRLPFTYSDRVYERLWWMAQEFGMPLLMHVRTPRIEMPRPEILGGGRLGDYWLPHSLAAIIFAGVFDRYPQLKIGAVEQNTAWIPHWLELMDRIYLGRATVAEGWRSREGMLPSDYWRRNMFVEFTQDDLGIQLRDQIGVENMLWGNDYPRMESTWPRSRDFISRAFEGVPPDHVRSITALNAARIFGFETRELLPKEQVPRFEHPTDAATDNPRPVLHRGKVGHAVSSLQSRLRAHGFDISVDGNFGPATELAVKQFQLQKGLVSDGIVGPKTWEDVDVRASETPDAGENPATPGHGTETEIKPDDQLGVSEQARHLNAWLHEDHPMVGRSFKVSVNIGPLSPSAATSAAFTEPTWEGVAALSLVVSLFALDCEIDPDWQELELPRKGSTEIVSFNITPRRPGKREFTIRVYLARRLILLQSSTFLVDIGVEELLGAGA